MKKYEFKCRGIVEAETPEEAKQLIEELFENEIDVVVSEDGVCVYCEGEGEVSCDEMFEGNIQKGTGTEKCECQIEK